MLSSPPGETGQGMTAGTAAAVTRACQCAAGVLWGGCAHAPGLEALPWGQGPAAMRLMAKRHWEGTWSGSVLLKLCAWELVTSRWGDLQILSDFQMAGSSTQHKSKYQGTKPGTLCGGSEIRPLRDGARGQPEARKGVQWRVQAAPQKQQALTGLPDSVYSHWTVSLWLMTPCIPSTKSMIWLKAARQRVGRLMVQQAGAGHSHPCTASPQQGKMSGCWEGRVALADFLARPP